MISFLLFFLYTIAFYKSLSSKNQEIVNYLIVGVLTTIVSIVSYYLFRSFIDNYLICTIISWIIAVLFAYVTNRRFVFKSKNKKILKEFISFVVSRLLSLGIEVLSMIILVDLLSIDDRISKILVQVIIIVLNYIFSKIFVFKRKD